LRAYLSLINFITASGEFFFAVAWLSYYHGLDLISILLLHYFNLSDRTSISHNAIALLIPQCDRLTNSLNEIALLIPYQIPWKSDRL
jgi:hypothetical protein